MTVTIERPRTKPTPWWAAEIDDTWHSPENCRVVRITRVIAEEWLKRNTHNRPISEYSVRKLMQAMRSGEYVLTGEPILFDRLGVLLDGQHRLMAVLRSGIAIDTYVIFDLDPKVFEYLGNVMPRRPRDVFGAAGCKHAKTLEPIARMIQFWVRGYIPYVGTNHPEIRPTNRQLMNIYRDNPDLPNAVLVAEDCGKALGVPGLFGFTFWLANRVHPEDAAVLFSQLAGGEGLTKDDPAHTLREMFVRQGRGHAIPRATALAYLFKTWNAHHAGERLKFLRWSKTEQFPEFAGDKLFNSKPT